MKLLGLGIEVDAFDIPGLREAERAAEKQRIRQLEVPPAVVCMQQQRGIRCLGSQVLPTRDSEEPIFLVFEPVTGENVDSSGPNGMGQFDVRWMIAYNV